MNLQPIFDIPEICYRLGIKQAVISPGSRNGALTIAFSRHSAIECFSVPDERSAAFIALGMSLQTKKPTVLVCTSGSAGLNYAPAVAEAYFNRVPLLILTADRPEELIDIRDGQTIYQKNLYGKHTRAFFDLPTNSLKETHQVLSHAINLTTQEIHGPVHLNIACREPFYPNTNQEYNASEEIELNSQSISPKEDEFPKDIQSFQKTLIIVGQQDYDSHILHLLEKISNNNQAVVLGDIIANTHSSEVIIRHHDLYLNDQLEELKPDLIITTGLSVLSKKLKNFVRSCDSLSHWHIGLNGDSSDTFGKLTKTIKIKEETFLTQYSNSAKPSTFQSKWFQVETRIKQKLKNYQPHAFSEVSAFRSILKCIPENSDIHLANSMTIRYASMLGITSSGTHIYCNRGTSGIDGSNSTAVGSAIVSKRPTLLLTGDVSFFYDRNAFWHHHVPDHVLIILFNNAGGGIFRLIPGPSEQPELEEFFETRQQSNAEHLSKEFGFQYTAVNGSEDLEKIIQKTQTFMSGKEIIEIFTDKHINQKNFKHLMHSIAN